MISSRPGSLPFSGHLTSPPNPSVSTDTVFRQVVAHRRYPTSAPLLRTPRAWPGRKGGSQAQRAQPVAEYGMAKAPRLCRRRSSAACHLACAKGGNFGLRGRSEPHADWDWTDGVAGVGPRCVSSVLSGRDGADGVWGVRRSRRRQVLYVRGGGVGAGVYRGPRRRRGEAADGRGEGLGRRAGVGEPFRPVRR